MWYITLTCILMSDPRKGECELVSCQIKDYQGAPLKLTATLFHFLLPHHLFARPVREMERVSRVLEGGQNGLERERRGMKCWQSNKQTITRRKPGEESELTVEQRVGRGEGCLITGTLSGLIYGGV